VTTDANESFNNSTISLFAHTVFPELSIKGPTVGFTPLFDFVYVQKDFESFLYSLLLLSLSY